MGGKALFDSDFSRDMTKLWYEVLRYQCSLFSPAEIDILDSLGMSRCSGPLLDLGCGIGVYSLQLRKHFPHLKIMGVDLNDGLLRVFRTEVKKAGAEGIRVARWDAGNDPPPAGVGGCRAALVSVVLQHSPRPLMVLSALRNALPPKSPIFIIEEDDGWALSDPPCKPLDRVLAAWQRYQTAHGGTRFIGRQIPRLAREAGLIVEDLRLCAHSSVRLGLRPMLRLFMLSLPLLADGSRHGLSKREAQKIWRALEEFAAAHADDCSLMFPKIIVRAVVP